MLKNETNELQLFELSNSSICEVGRKLLLKDPYFIFIALFSELLLRGFKSIELQPQTKDRDYKVTLKKFTTSSWYRKTHHFTPLQTFV